ncbi:MAG: 3-deoxy-7-phosphoheptulonate synthase [bacterium]|nr:3-deoxy-7-phosphoheptulonate synthase [bacterium]
MPSEPDAPNTALDRLDQRIIEALAERQKLIDQATDLETTPGTQWMDSRNEQECLTRLAEQGAATDLDAHFVTRVFREILQHTSRRQQRVLLDSRGPGQGSAEALIVGFQGTHGAYSHIAATQHFATRHAQVSCKGYTSFQGMLEGLSNSETDYAVLPIENTTAGSINAAYDALARMNLALVGEEVVRVEHCLLALEPLPISHIRRVYSHPQALDQCSVFLNSLNDCEAHAFTDTAMAARRLRDDQDLSEAAIASEEAARLYGLTVIKQGIANQKQNFTRFVIVARDSVRFDPGIPCKTSIIFATRHEEGALATCLNVLANHHLNLSKLESRPRPNTPWEYLFYADFDGNMAEEQVEQGLRDLAAQTSFLKILGSYPSCLLKSTEANEPSGTRPRAVTGAGTVRLPTPAAGTQPTPDILQTLEKKPYRLVSRVNRLEDTVLRVGSVSIGGDRPVIIAGPCSVESREQVMACAERVRALGGHILRGGCFKPRTSPYAFQGLGLEGLELLAEAGQAHGLPIITEVLHPADVEDVAAQADILQIGTRNMQNYALLKEVGRVDRPVLLKRGMMASIDEWLGAAEYVLAQGNQQVILCERGIRTFETATRSTLDLSAIPVVRERTHLPIIVDPSHACGTWRWVADLTAAALACRAHGVMVEIHPEPAKALSDGPQSLDFDRFGELMERIHQPEGDAAS